jgi:glycosyltransferase involved in cell wall biosynthesis
MPAVSIVVTAYNIEGYIEQCLTSLAEQTLRDIEVIVVDDGSTDATPDLITAFAANDPRFVPVLLPDNSVGGVATAANAGLDRVTAPYVGFADGDDFCEPTMFEKLLAAATSADSDLAMCKYQEIDDAAAIYRDPAEGSRWARLSGTAFRLNHERRKQFLRFIAVPWRKLYRRELLEANSIRFPVGDFYYEDNPFHWFSIVSATSLAVVPEVLCYHRVARTGQTMVVANAGLLRIFEHHDIIRAWLVERGLEETYAPTLVGWVVSQLEWIALRTPAELQRELFDAVAAILSQYDESTVRAALREGEKGVLAMQLTDAVARQNFRAFSRALALRSAPAGLVDKARYHLRYSGVRQTGRIAVRYGAQRLDRLSRQVPILRGRRDAISNRDVMFGLAVVQRQLETVERLLRKLEADRPEPGSSEPAESGPRR